MSLSQRPPAIKQALPGIQNPTIKPVPGAAISSSLDSFQKLRPDELGNMVNANMADYLVPMAGGMPDIRVGHVETPTQETELGAKGAGEAGAAGAPGAVMNAINDALSPFDVRVTHQPITPERILKALGKF